MIHGNDNETVIVDLNGHVQTIELGSLYVNAGDLLKLHQYNAWAEEMRRLQEKHRGLIGCDSLTMDIQFSPEQLASYIVVTADNLEFGENLGTANDMIQLGANTFNEEAQCHCVFFLPALPKQVSFAPSWNGFLGKKGLNMGKFSDFNAVLESVGSQEYVETVEMLKNRTESFTSGNCDLLVPLQGRTFFVQYFAEIPENLRERVSILYEITTNKYVFLVLLKDPTDELEDEYNAVLKRQEQVNRDAEDAWLRAHPDKTLKNMPVSLRAQKDLLIKEWVLKRFSQQNPEFEYFQTTTTTTFVEEVVVLEKKRPRSNDESTVSPSTAGEGEAAYKRNKFRETAADEQNQQDCGFVVGAVGDGLFGDAAADILSL